MRTFGLIGKNLSHSFSKIFFKEKIIKEQISNTRYLNFELAEISEFLDLITQKNISGLNVTIPYKESIIPYLDELTEDAKNISAVNTIEFIGEKVIGHNTDIIGFRKSIIPILKNRKKAIILGSGGSSKAVQYSLDMLNIEYVIIGRNTPASYTDMNSEFINYYDIIINTTPLGMFPNIKDYPEIPFQFLSNKHLLFDLIYNPKETLFLKQGKEQGCSIKNGLEMLQIQAEASWKIWTNKQ